MDITLNIGQAIPGAPLGILGGFIEQKLRLYVEPERAGTPRGAPIGLSRKKFHAALLSLTNIDLRKQAKLIRVSYGVLRKWRTEDAFLDCSANLMMEFFDGPLEEACMISLHQFWKDPDMTYEVANGIDLDAVGVTRGVVGFEDITLYGPMLELEMHHRFNAELKEAAKTGKMVFPCLRFFRPLLKLTRDRTPAVDDDRMKHLAMHLTAFQINILWLTPEDREYQRVAAATLGEMIYEVLKA